MRGGMACATSRRGLSTLAEQSFTLDTDSFVPLETPAKRVFITEIEINFLAFPARSDSLIIVGSGYGFEALPQTNWLRERALYY